MWFLAIPILLLAGYEVYTHRSQLFATAPPPTPLPPTTQPGIVPTATGPKGTGVIDPTDPAQLAAAAAAQKAAEQAALDEAVSKAAAAVAAQQAAGGQPTIAEAAKAAEIVKLQMIDALNTPEGARSPEQTALLGQLAGLPVLDPNVR